MIEETPEVFGHIQELPDGTLDDGSMSVVIEKQMNISSENCCVLAAIQMHYEMQGVECVILNPTNLEKHFSSIFTGTKGNRSKRKTAINKYGKRLLTLAEKSKAPTGVSKADSTKKRKRKGPSFSIHALDAMFYGLVYCKISPDINLDIGARRITRDSQLQGELRQRVLAHHGKGKKSRKK
jgi:hypothetical protein